jgi:hypothetical protein
MPRSYARGKEVVLGNGGTPQMCKNSAARLAVLLVGPIRQEVFPTAPAAMMEVNAC